MKKDFIKGVAISATIIILSVILAPNIDAHIKDELYNDMKSDVTLKLNSREVVCYDIRDVGVDVGVDEPFTMETRYYIKSVDDTASDYIAKPDYITKPSKQLEIGEHLTEYIISATVPSTTNDTSDEGGNHYEVLSVYYYDKAEEGLRKEQAIEQVEGHIKKEVEKATELIGIGIYMSAIGFICITWIVIIYSGNYTLIIEKEKEDEQTPKEKTSSL